MSNNNKETELNRIFRKLDVDGDGSICLEDLVAALEDRKEDRKEDHAAAPLREGFAEMFLRNADKNNDGLIDFSEFVKYIENRDHRISLAFKQIDCNGKNVICLDDIKVIFRKMNISLSNNEAELLLKKIDKCGKLNISIEEWRDFLFFHPAHSMEQIIYFWQHGNFIDAGADWIIPEEFKSGDDEYSLQFKRLMSGGFAGAVSRSVTAPLDRVKVLLQVHGYKHIDSGIVKSIKYMLSEGGFVSLWRGNGINVLKIVPESALKYSLYEHYKLLFRKNSESNKADQSLREKFLAGSLAGVSSQTVIYPLETMKTRLCLRKTGQFHSTIHCAKMIYKEGGLRAFYRGFFINIAGIVPYAGIELTLYEKCKSLYMRWANIPDTHHPHPLVVPFISSFSATCGILTTYPFALIRTKLQSKSEFSIKTIDSPLGLFKTIWQDAGIKGLYRGVTANLCKVLPASSISYLTYEHLNSRFKLKSFGSE